MFKLALKKTSVIKTDEEKKVWSERKENHRKGREMFETGEMSFSEIREDSE